MIKAGNSTYQHAGDIPETVAIFPLTGALLLPGGNLPLNIFEPRYLEMVDHAMCGSKIIGMIQPCLKSRLSCAATTPLCSTGCLGRISAIQETGDGRYTINLAGICRYSVAEELDVDTPYRQCRIEPFESDFVEPGKRAGSIDRDALLSAFRNFLRANNMEADWDSIESTDSETLVTALCMMCPYEPAEKQALLEAPCSRTRAETLIAISELHLARQADGEGGQLQ